MNQLLGYNFIDSNYQSHLCDRLDASIALTVIEVMKRLSEKGKMIITVLHQPRAKIFNLIDRVMILGFLQFTIVCM